MSTSQPLSSGGEHFSKRAWGALLVLCGALFLDALDVSMIGVALPSIKTDLHMSTSSLQWVVSAYVLGYGADAICPRLALETVAEQAAADKVGGDRPNPEEAQRRLAQAYPFP